MISGPARSAVGSTPPPPSAGTSSSIPTRSTSPSSIRSAGHRQLPGQARPRRRGRRHCQFGLPACVARPVHHPLGRHRRPDPGDPGPGRRRGALLSDLHRVPQPGAGGPRDRPAAHPGRQHVANRRNPSRPVGGGRHRRGAGGALCGQIARRHHGENSAAERSHRRQSARGRPDPTDRAVPDCRRDHHVPGDGLAILPIARRSVLDLRSMAARPMRSSVWQRYNLDLFAIALSLVVLFQLAQRGFVNLTGGEVTLDPLAIIFPVLLLFTGALILLRLLPWLLRGIGWAMTQVRSMSFALPGWHLGRNPIPYGRLALLVWLTTGLGAFALTYADTLDQSFSDRAAFTAGSDVRIVAEKAGFLGAPDTDTSTAVLRTEVLPVRVGAGLPRCWRSAPKSSPRWSPGGATSELTHPSRSSTRSDPTASCQTSGSNCRPMPPVADGRHRCPATWLQKETFAAGDGEPDPSLRLMVKTFDAKGQVWTMQADRDFVDSGWTVVEVDLASGLNRSTSHRRCRRSAFMQCGSNAAILRAATWRMARSCSSPTSRSSRRLANSRSRRRSESSTPLNGLVLRSGVSGDVAAAGVLLRGPARGCRADPGRYRGLATQPAGTGIANLIADGPDPGQSGGAFASAHPRRSVCVCSTVRWRPTRGWMSENDPAIRWRARSSTESWSALSVRCRR